jgi:prepilin-type N-terminal cleavage/methylation domain-containing protein
MVSFAPLVGTQKHKQGFTLIELLVVIAIIAILAGLLFPAGQSAINAAKKTTAKNQVVQIATAITAYETEYGRLPAGSFSNVNQTLVQILCTTNNSNNPRGLIFLEATAWKNGKGGTNSAGFCDPFSAANVYSVALDTNYANTLSFSVNGTATNLTKHIAVWSTPRIGRTNVLINSWD